MVEKKYTIEYMYLIKSNIYGDYVKKVELYYVELDKLNEEIINNLPYIKDEDYLSMNKYSGKKNKLQHLISFYFKRKYLGDFFLNEYGKPLANERFASISHSDNLVIVGVGDTDIGVDVEKVKPVRDDLKRYVTIDSEYEKIKNDTDFFKVWTAKEALIKCLGLSISKVKNVPAFPLDGKKEYLDNNIYTKEVVINDYVIAVCVKETDEFEIIINKEEIQ